MTSAIDTSKELPCGFCHGKQEKHPCLICEGKGSFPGFQLKDIFAIILTKQKDLRKSFPRNPQGDDTLILRANYVWKLARVFGGQDTGMVSTLALDIACTGDPYRPHLELIAQVVSDKFFGTHKAPAGATFPEDEKPENNVPNFEGMSHDELTEFWKKYHRASRADATFLVGERPRKTNLAATLAAYAMDRACAMKLREEGDIKAAETYEHAMQLRYESLPVDLRW